MLRLNRMAHVGEAGAALRSDGRQSNLTWVIRDKVATFGLDAAAHVP